MFLFEQLSPVVGFLIAHLLWSSTTCPLSHLHGKKNPSAEFPSCTWVKKKRGVMLKNKSNFAVVPSKICCTWAVGEIGRCKWSSACWAQIWTAQWAIDRWGGDTNAIDGTHWWECLQEVEPIIILSHLTWHPHQGDRPEGWGRIMWAEDGWMRYSGCSPLADI